MKNLVLLLFFFVLIGISCTEDCCVDGERINVPGNLHCVSDINLEGVVVTATSNQGDVFTVTTDQDGNFNFPELPIDEYTLKFSNNNLYPYDTTELNFLRENIRDILLGVTLGTPADFIAYEINFVNGLTTLDFVTYDKLKEGEITLNDIVLPWRYVRSSDLANGDIYHTDEFVIDLADENINLLDITAIYFGDPIGQFCE